MTTPNVSDGIWNTLEHVPADAVLGKLAETVATRWPNPEGDVGANLETLCCWLDGDTDRADPGEALVMIEAVNSLAYNLRRQRPLVLIPHGVQPTDSSDTLFNYPYGILGLGSQPVIEAYQRGVRDVDAVLTRPLVRGGLNTESGRYCFRCWMAGEGRLKPHTEAVLRQMAERLLARLERGV
jgi:hypothetical protein